VLAFRAQSPLAAAFRELAVAMAAAVPAQP
jgi:hypothetical protein